MTLAEALERLPNLVEPHLGQHADYKNQPFVALNTAFWRDGVFIHVSPGTVVEEPIVITHTAPTRQDTTLCYRRVLIVRARGSQARVVEQFSGPASPYMTNAVTEVVLAEGAHLDHYKVQEESTQAFHVATTQVVQARGSNFSTHYVGLGGA